MSKIIITAPHSSYFVPKELRARFTLTDSEIKDACDIGTFELASLIQDKSIMILPADVSRLVVDINRFADDIRTIGLFRERTFRGKNIYLEGKNLTEREKDYYKKLYYNKWHEKFLRFISDKPIDLHIDLHNTDENRYCASAYTPRQPIRMDDVTDFDIANRSKYKNYNDPIDELGLTFPSEKMNFVFESINNHMRNFNKSPLRITASHFLKGGPIIQLARDNGNWTDKTPKSLQFELQRQFFINDTGKIDQSKINKLADALIKVIVDILKIKF